MASLKDLRDRIKSVKNTQQITKTMKMVAAAKVRRARTACDAARPYSNRLQNTVANLARSTNSSWAPLLLRGRTYVKTVRLIVVGADRGLCGGFNVNLNKRVVMDLSAYYEAGKHVQIVTVGRKAYDLIKGYAATHDEVEIVDTYMDVGKEDAFELATKIGQQSIDDYADGKCDLVEIIYMECASMMLQKPTNHQIIPFKAHGPQLVSSYEYEPSEEEILRTLLPRTVKTQIFSAILDSAASEQAARMTAMDNATRNAGEMIKGLTLDYNRSRQAQITKELIEIISGAEAV